MIDLSKIEPLPDLGPKLKQCLIFIAWYFQKHAKYPTQSEIARGIRLSPKTKTASGYVDPLVRKGFLIKSTVGGKRNIRLTQLADKILSEEDINNFDHINSKCIKKKAY
jgi:predicted transcriptional regulator